MPTTSGSTPATAISPTLEASNSKLRSSCDGCGTAKVKCDRRRPRCNRCETQSLACVYGPSRKLGKPPRKMPRIDQVASIEKRQCIAPRSHVHESTQNVFSSLETEITPLSSGTNVASGFDGQNMLSAEFYPFMPLGEWPLDSWNQFDDLGAGLNPSSAAIEPAGTVNKSREDPHSCPRESYEIFRDLICPSPYLHVPDSNSVTVSAQLDEVLQFNREAIDRLTQVLRCPCAKSGHRAMVHASIVSRILIWYQQAAGWTTSPSESSDPQTSRSPQPSSMLASCTSTSSLVKATGFSVEHVPVSVGSFSIEDTRVQAIFRNQLVLSELKKTADLIDLFTSQDLGESGVAGLYSHLGAWLRNELSRTVRMLKSNLSSLKEDLES